VHRLRDSISSSILRIVCLLPFAEHPGHFSLPWSRTVFVDPLKGLVDFPNKEISDFPYHACKSCVVYGPLSPSLRMIVRPPILVVEHGFFFIPPFRVVRKGGLPSDCSLAERSPRAVQHVLFLFCTFQAKDLHPFLIPSEDDSDGVLISPLMFPSLLLPLLVVFFRFLGRFDPLLYVPNPGGSVRCLGRALVPPPRVFFTWTVRWFRCSARSRFCATFLSFLMLLSCGALTSFASVRLSLRFLRGLFLPTSVY